MQTTIYALCDPETDLIRYIGKANDPEKRLKRHLVSPLYDRPCHRVNWIRSLVSIGLAPRLKIIEVIDSADASARERFWISEMRRVGIRLVNERDGGEGGGSPSLTTRTKIAAKARGRICPVEARRKIAVAMRARPFTAEHRARISTAKKGKSRPDVAARWIDHRCTRSCGYCGGSVTRKSSRLQKSKSGEVFCNTSCAARWRVAQPDWNAAEKGARMRAARKNVPVP